MIAGIIQARMGSTRLPGKVLKEVDGKPLLKYQVERVSKSTLIDKVIVATSSLDQDKAIVNFCEQNHIEVFKGSENDVLGRYYLCAKQYNADTIVRLTADCPLSDPVVIDEVITLFKEQGVDYAANTAPPETRTYPDGSDVEVFSFSALEKAYNTTVSPRDREHVTFFFWEGDSGFKTAQLMRENNWAGYRFTVDYPEDFEVVEFLIMELKKRNRFGHLQEIIKILDSTPKIKAKNSQYRFGAGWNK